MSALLRARVSAFLAGVAVAGVIGVYQLRGDVAEGQQRLLEQVGRGRKGRCSGGSSAPGPLERAAFGTAACRAGWEQVGIASSGRGSTAWGSLYGSRAVARAATAVQAIRQTCCCCSCSVACALTNPLHRDLLLFSNPLQTKKYTTGLEARVAELEAAVARLNSKA